MKVPALVAALVFASGLAGAANATVIFTDKNAPQSDEQNILFGSAQTGKTINGATNQSSTPVVFTSTQMLETNGIGQGFLTAAGSTNRNPIEITDISFSVPGHTFGDFIFNALNGSGTEVVTVFASDGTFTHEVALGNGENYLTITTADNETISSVSVSAAGGFDSFRQPRVSEISGVTTVPEPASMALLGVGLAGLGFTKRRPPATRGG